MNFKNKKNIIIAFLAITAWSTIAYFYGPEKPAKNKIESITSEDITPEENHTIEAFVYAQEQIEKQIKSPSSAEWPIASESLLHQKGNIYTFKSYFDSQNSFGAMIRTKYICVVEENNNLYTIKNLQLFN
jgi:hypothetical protein